MLYKYLNPNLVMVGTVATAGSKPTISIYFIDAITGKFLISFKGMIYYRLTQCLPFENPR